MNFQSLKKHSGRLYVLIFIVVLFLFTVEFPAHAIWQPPTNYPPASDVVLPLHEGSVMQVKQGALRVGGITVDQALLVPVQMAGETLLPNVLVAVGGIMQADDFCLNSNPDVCLSSESQITRRTIFSGGATLPGAAASYRCHPSGVCEALGSATENFFGLIVPFKMDIKNLKVLAQPTLPDGSACNVTLVRAIGQCGSGSTQNILTCSLTGSGPSCQSMPGASSGPLNPGDCLQLRFDRVSGNCPASVGWSFEGHYFSWW